MTDRELLQQALEVVDACMDTSYVEPEDNAAWLLLRARLAQPEREPVAWRWENSGKDKWLNKYVYLDNGGPDNPEECEPLYAAPPPAAHPSQEINGGGYSKAQLENLIAKHMKAAQPVPLTDAQIEEVRQRIFSTGNPYCPVDNQAMRKAARAIEAAHGIKETK